MPLLELDQVAKRYNGRPALTNVSLSVIAGEFTVILGPSGSGKSTILRTLCGAESVDGGAIRIDGQDAHKLSVRERRCVLVSQSDALYPNLTVAQNIEHPLKLAGLGKPAREEIVSGLARTLRLGDVMGRRPGSLSVGERLRVAIARASGRQPRVLLFDEPWSDLDAAARMEMQFELISLRWRLDATLVLVTRDQGAAMALADRIVVINRGEIEQVGSPREIFSRPATPFVAGYVGQPPMNLLIVGSAHGNLRLRGKPDITLPDHLAREIAARRADHGGDDILLGIRPEKVRLGVESGFDARVLRTEEIEGRRVVHLDLNGQHLSAITASADRPPPGTRIRLDLPADACHIFPPQAVMRPRAAPVPAPAVALVAVA